MPARYVTVMMTENQARVVLDLLEVFMSQRHQPLARPSVVDVQDATTVAAKIERELSWPPRIETKEGGGPC